MSNTYYVLAALLAVFTNLSQAWEPAIDPWDSRVKGHGKPGLKLAVARYASANCSIEMDQTHPRGDRADEQKSCLNWEFPFHSFAFEYPRMLGNGDDGWLQLRGCMITLYRHKNCKGQLERRELFPSNCCANVLLRTHKDGELTFPFQDTLTPTRSNV